MSLTNPNTPVSQQDLQDFYHKILPYIGGDAKMPAEDMSEVISPLPSTRPSRSTIKKQVLTAGQTAITFNDIPTTGDYIVDFFNALGINYTSVSQIAGSITLTYPSQQNDLAVYCEIREV